MLCGREQRLDVWTDRAATHGMLCWREQRLDVWTDGAATNGMLCRREQRLDIWTNGAATNGSYFHATLSVNALQRVCNFVVNRVVRDFAGLVTGAVPSLLVNVSDQLLPVPGEASHPFGIADFPSFYWKVTFKKKNLFFKNKIIHSNWIVMAHGDSR